MSQVWGVANPGSRPNMLDRRASEYAKQPARMSSDDAIEFEGKVVEVLSGGTFKVNVGEGHDVIAKLAGKMRRYRIRVVLGDRVTVAVSPYDPTRGRITYRPR